MPVCKCFSVTITMILISFFTNKNMIYEQYYSYSIQDVSSYMRCKALHLYLYFQICQAEDLPSIYRRGFYFFNFVGVSDPP